MKKLVGHEYANAGVVEYANGDIALQSYSTIVVVINAGVLHCTGLYSRTTIKHIGWFMKQYGHGLNYYDVKDAYLNRYDINLETGEIFPY